jgi:hypothetical protein
VFCNALARDMNRSVSAYPGVWAMAMMALALLACSEDMASSPQPGLATVAFAPRPLTIPYIDLSSARLRLDRLEIIGNVPPPLPAPGQPPPLEPPPRPPGIDLDALSEGTSETVEDLPQGLYSRVRFLLGRVTLEGTVQATKFHVTLRPFGRVVDIRASMPQELGFERDITFEVTLEPNFWFPPGLFQGAMLDSRGEIVCDDVSNYWITAALVDAVSGSFHLP